MVKLQPKSVLMVMIGAVIVLTGSLYAYQNQINGQTTSSKTSPSDIITDEKPVSAVSLSEGWVGKPTFVLNQNTTTLNVNHGANVSSSISLNILINKPIRFYIDDRGFNTTKSTLPSGISVMMSVNGVKTQPEFLSQILGPMLSKTTPVPTVVGQASIPYTISISNNVPPGMYQIKFICASFQPNSINKILFNMNQSSEVVVTLNVV